MVRKAVAIIGARLNSSRLPRKHLLPLAGKPLISHIVSRLKQVEELDDIIIATTADSYNEDLVHWAHSNNVNVYAHGGDVNDLMGRVDQVVHNTNADIIVYICGDSPLIEPSTISSLVAAMKANLEADHARLPQLPSGQHYIHEGFSVYGRSFWDVMIEAAHEPFEREHVGAVYHSLNKVAPDNISYGCDDTVFHSISHRISVDTVSDYDFMRTLYDDWYQSHEADTIVDLKWVITRLKSEPELQSINAHVHQKMVLERNKKIIFLTEAGQRVGLGHLKRTVIAARQLQDHLGVSVSIEVMGRETPIEWLAALPHNWHDGPYERGFLQELVEQRDVDFAVLDVQQYSHEILADTAALKAKSVQTIAVDFVQDKDFFDAYYIPCFYAKESYKERYGRRLVSGWPAYLLDPPVSDAEVEGKNKLLVLTGGGDFYGLGEVWPIELLRSLPKGTEVTWVQGPYADPPCFPGDLTAANVTILKGAADLSHIMARHTMALCVYGVSFFECIRQGLAVSAYVTPQKMNTEELQTLVRQDVAFLSDDPAVAVQNVVQLISNDYLAKRFVEKCSALWGAKEQVPPLVELLKQMDKQAAA